MIKTLKYDNVDTYDIDDRKFLSTIMVKIPTIMIKLKYDSYDETSTIMMTD